MNREEAKEILLPYRPGTDDANDPQVTEALALAKMDSELGHWLEEHATRQNVLREKFRSIPAPDGLMQQIVSEHAAAKRTGFLKKNRKVVVLAAVMLLLVTVFYWWQQQPQDDARLAEYQNQMAFLVSMSYGMDLATNDADSIRDYLKQKAAPADFALTEPLKHTTLTGCAVENWQNKKVSLVCFHTGDTATSAGTSDLWLFVVDRKLVRDAPDTATPQFSQIRNLAVAAWTDGDKLYLLGRQGQAQDLKRFL